MKAGLEVSLNGTVVGRCNVCTARCTVEKEIKCAIALVCWARGDDLLATHSLDEFTVKGTCMEE